LRYAEQGRANEDGAHEDGAHEDGAEDDGTEDDGAGDESTEEGGAQQDGLDMTASPGPSEVVDALLAASRAMVGLAARSLANLDAEVTLPQFRALVVLAARGPQRAADVAAELGVNPSTGTRMCDRLVRKGLVRRARTTGDRRVVRLALTAAGRSLVEDVTRRRREELARIVAAMPANGNAALVRGLHSFALAAGELPEDEWWLGWQDGDDTDGKDTDGRDTDGEPARSA
jgi:DNA-binding MarR family transcriptional regulator